jgi:hypothetical protein
MELEITHRQTTCSTPWLLCVRSEDQVVSVDVFLTEDQVDELVASIAARTPRGPSDQAAAEIAASTEPRS